MALACVSFSRACSRSQYEITLRLKTYARQGTACSRQGAAIAWWLGLAAKTEASEIGVDTFRTGQTVAGLHAFAIVGGTTGN